MELIEIIALGIICSIILFISKSIFSLKLINKSFVESNTDNNINEHFDEKSIEFVRIKIKEDSFDNPSFDLYFERLSHYVELAKNNLNVLEYLPSNNVIQGLYQTQNDEKTNNHINKKNVEGLLKRFETYYSLVKRVVRENPNIEYIRVLQVTGWLRNNLGDSRLEIIKNAIKLMPPHLINHIGEMLHDSCSNRFKLYILTEPVVVYNYMIVDKDYVLSEYFRYNKNGVNFPDEMYVNRCSTLGEQLKKRYKLFYEIISGEKPITKDEFNAAINSFIMTSDKDKEYEDKRDAVLRRLKDYNKSN